MFVWNMSLKHTRHDTGCTTAQSHIVIIDIAHHVKYDIVIIDIVDHVKYDMVHPHLTISNV